MIHKLDLTSEQKVKVAALLKKYRPEMESIAKGIGEAHKAFMTAASAKTYSQDAVKAAADGVAAQMARGMALRARIVNEALPILDARQRARYDRMEEFKLSHMGNRSQRMLDGVDKWIAEHSE